MLQSKQSPKSKHCMNKHLCSLFDSISQVNERNYHDILDSLELANRHVLTWWLSSPSLVQSLVGEGHSDKLIGECVGMGDYLQDPAD